MPLQFHDCLDRPTLKTLPSPHSIPASGDRAARYARSAALTDALLEFADQQEPEPKRLGVIPAAIGDVGADPISLGSRRLCNDQPFQAADRTELVAAIEWTRVTLFRQAVRAKAPGPPDPFRDQNLTRGRFNGYMSRATRSKVRRIVSTWVRAIMIYRAEIKRKYDPGRAYPVFLTVTLPSDQVHSDREINRACLQPFLQYLRRHHGIEQYFWRAEAQENGRVHFHILTDRYIRAEDLQHAWNKHVNALGYVDRYFEKTGEANPPSTEIHRIRDKVRDPKTGKLKTVDPVSYLVDYVLDVPQPDDTESTLPEDQQGPRKLIGKYRDKEGKVCTFETRAIEGRVWGMSDGLREIREPRAEASTRLVHALQSAADRGQLRRVDTEHSTMFFGNVAVVLGRAHAGMWKVIRAYYVNVFANLYPLQLPAQYARDNPPLDPLNLWVDLQEFALYHRTPYETDSPSFATEAELLRWLKSNRPDHYRQLLRDQERAAALNLFNTAA